MNKKWNHRVNPVTGRYEIEVRPGDWVSRQRASQLNKRAEGKCPRCGKRLGTYAWACDKCVKALRVKKREAMGHKAWKRGGVGRPPRSQAA